MRIFLRLFAFVAVIAVISTGAAILGARLPDRPDACINYSISNRSWIVDITRGRIEQDTRGMGRIDLTFGSQTTGSLFLLTEGNAPGMHIISTTYRLILERAEGGARTLMTGIPGAQNVSGLMTSRARFSPSGDRAAFYWLKEQEAYLSLIDIETGNVQTVPVELPERARTDAMVIAGWSADGRYVALSLRPAMQLRYLFLDTETMTLVPFAVTPAEYASGREALANGLEVWSPEGHTFAAMLYPPGGRRIDEENANWLTLFTPGAPEPLITVPLSFPLEFAEIIHWSPSGDALVVGWKERTCWRDRCTEGWHFALIHRDGTIIMPDLEGLRLDLREFGNRSAPLVSGDNEPLPGTWSPDGREWIFFNSYAGEPVDGDILDYRLDLVAFNLETRMARALAHDVEPAWAMDMQFLSQQARFSEYFSAVTHGTSRDPRLFVVRRADVGNVSGLTAEIIDIRDERRTSLVENATEFNDLILTQSFSQGSQTWSYDGRYLMLAYQTAPDSAASPGIAFAQSDLERTTIIARIDSFDSIRNAQIVPGFSYETIDQPAYAYVVGTQAGSTRVEIVNLDTGERRRMFEGIAALDGLVQASVSLTPEGWVMLHINGTGVDTPRALFRQAWDAPTYETLIPNDIDRYTIGQGGNRFAYLTPIRLGRFELRVTDANGAPQATFPLQAQDYQYLGALNNCRGFF